MQLSLSFPPFVRANGPAYTPETKLGAYTPETESYLSLSLLNAFYRTAYTPQIPMQSLQQQLHAI